MSNLKQNLENALDAVYKTGLNSELLNILNDKTLTGEEIQKKFNEQLIKSVNPFYEPHRKEMPLSIFINLLIILEHKKYKK
jgi:hypothetical protein